MATYNPPEDLLRAQIESIRAQTHANWLCVISDDGSTPAAYATLLEVIGDDPRFTKLYFEQYVSLNPFLTLPHFTAVDEVKSVRDLIPWSEIEETRFYREWMLPNLQLLATGEGLVRVLLPMPRIPSIPFNKPGKGLIGG